MPLKKDSIKEKNLALHYKWEFIRRNKKYKSDYKKFSKNNTLDSRKAVKYLYEEYGMGYPIDPRLSLVEHVRKILKYHESSSFKDDTFRTNSILLCLRRMFPYDFAAYCSKPLGLKHDLYDVDTPVPFESWERVAHVKVNLTKSYKAIMKELEYIVKKSKKFYNIIEPSTTTRNTWVLYDRYLEIWDMNHMDGKSYTQIASKLNIKKKLGFEDNTRKMLAAAEEMVDGGFRKISNTPMFR